jgi:hypothetical protein
MSVVLFMTNRKYLTALALFILSVIFFSILIRRSEKNSVIAKDESAKGSVVSAKRSDGTIDGCPKPEYFLRVNDAYRDCLKDPGNKSKANGFVELLEKLMYRYDCRRNYDSEPIPAWWLCGEGSDYQKVSSREDPDKWFSLLSKLKTLKARKLFGSKLFRSTLDGEIAEIYFEASENAEKQLKGKNSH